jgi:hypothetical protein
VISWFQSLFFSNGSQLVPLYGAAGQGEGAALGSVSVAAIAIKEEVGAEYDTCRVLTAAGGAAAAGAAAAGAAGDDDDVIRDDDDVILL